MFCFIRLCPSVERPAFISVECFERSSSWCIWGRLQRSRHSPAAHAAPPEALWTAVPRRPQRGPEGQSRPQLRPPQRRHRQLERTRQRLMHPPEEIQARRRTNRSDQMIELRSMIIIIIPRTDTSNGSHDALLADIGCHAVYRPIN